MKILKSSKIFITGHRGMLGSVTMAQFLAAGYSNLLTASHKELDLCDQAAVNTFFAKENLNM